MGWQTLWSGSSTQNTTGYNGWTVIQRIDPSVYASIVGTPTKIRVEVTAPTSGQMVVHSFYVGHDGTDAFDFDGNQVQLAIGGNTAPTISTSTVVTTDAANFTFDPAEPLLIAASFNGTTSLRRGADTGKSGYQRNIGADAGTTNKSGYTAVGSPTLAFISKIELYVPDTVTADAGAITVSGQDAILGINSIAAAAGAIDVTGVAAGLKADRKIAAEVGAIDVTGVDAGLIPEKKVTADVGIIAVAGVAALTTAIRQMAADLGTIVVAGQTAQLPVSMPADTGTIAVAGQTAEVLATRLMAANVGTIAVTGVAAGTKRGYPLVADTGAISVAGIDANLRPAYKVVANAGSISVAGVAAEWSRTGWFTVWEGDLGTNGASGMAGVTGVMAFPNTARTALPSTLTGTGVRIRFTFAAPSEEDTALTEAWVGHAPSGGDAKDFDGGQRQITHSGGTTSFAISVNTDLVTDPILFSYDPTLQLNVAFYSTNSYVHQEGLSGLTFYTQAGNSASASDKTGSWSTDSNHARLIEKIEVFIGQAGPTLAAEAGAISVTGESAITTATRRLDAAAGAVAVTGVSAALRKSWPNLEADVGTIVVAGEEAELYGGKRVIADQGSIAVAGQAALFGAMRTIAADPGSIVVNGVDAGLRIGFRVTADVGAIDLSGQPALFDVDRMVIANAGSIAVSGVAATTRKGSKLIADTGAIDVNGVDATTRVGAKLIADRGLISVTGQIAGLQFHHKSIQLTGTYTVNGVAANMVRGRPMIAETGAYVVAGGAAIVVPSFKRRSVGAIAS